MRLEKALSVLSKSSPFAVSTKGEGDISLKEYKEYLYVESWIEKEFARSLQDLTTRSSGIIFLCGSSGDGKSEILNRYEAQYSQSVQFHLDGTHSYSPNETAVQTLDNLFSKYKLNQHPLVVGINIGMLGNYAEEGSEVHADVCNSIKLFLNRELHLIPEDHVFLYFEDDPKFSFDSGMADSAFTRIVMERLTTDRTDNPFYQLYLQEMADCRGSYLTSNYAMLSKREVQDVIVEVLLKVRLAKDQFLTARTLLDFLYEILCSKNYLFDALFNGGDNELLDKIETFDPVVARSNKLDQFIVQAEIGIVGAGFEDFKKAVRDLGVNDVVDAYSYVRMFYLLKKLDVGNNFHKMFFEVLKEESVSSYIKLWNLHQAVSSENTSQYDLYPFYEETLLAGIRSYVNRHSPSLGTNEYAVSSLNGVVIAARLKIEPDFSRIRKDHVAKRTSFNAYLIINKQPLPSFPVSLNFLELLFKLQKGYQPTRHDSGAVLLLQEIVDQIVSIASKQDTLVFSEGEVRYAFKNFEDKYIKAEGC